MAATLPDLETVALSRGASNGAALRIELNRPDRMNAWDKQLGLDLLAAVELAAGDAGDPRRDDHRRGPRVLVRRRPARRLRPASRRAAGRRHRPARALPPDHHRDPADAEAGAGGGQRAGGRDRLLARARLRPRARARVRLPAAGVREHRARARTAARPSSYPRAPAPGAPRRWRCWASGSRPRRRSGWGLVDVVAPDEDFARRGRRARGAARHGPDPLLRRVQGAAQRARVRQLGRAARARGLAAGGDGRLRRTSRRASRPSSRSARPGSPGSEQSGPISQYTALADGPPPPDESHPQRPRTGPRGAAADRGAGVRGADPAGGRAVVRTRRTPARSTRSSW